MDSFTSTTQSRDRAAPNTEVPLSTDEVVAQIKKLSAEHKAKGIPLSGRVLHVVHYLPVTATLNSSLSVTKSKSGVLSPPLTPPIRAGDVAPSPTEEKATELGKNAEESKSSGKWQLSTRWGHSAMISGIYSLGTHHSQLVVGWTGDILSPSSSLSSSSSSLSASSDSPTVVKVPVSSISEEDRKDLEKTIEEYQPEEDNEKPRDDGVERIKYVPLWLEDSVAHGHYDGYCKMSTYIYVLYAMTDTRC